MPNLRPFLKLKELSSPHLPAIPLICSPTCLARTGHVAVEAHTLPHDVLWFVTSGEMYENNSIKDKRREMEIYYFKILIEGLYY